MAAMEIKLMIDPKSKKLIFAEASKDFVDFLFVLPSLPIGKAIKLLESDSFGGSIRNILTNVGTNLDRTYLQPQIEQHRLLDPMVFSPVTNKQLSITGSSFMEKFYTCSRSNCHKPRFTNEPPSWYPVAACHYCKGPRDQEIRFDGRGTLFIKPWSDDSAQGYVREKVQYMVFDDLSVKPLLTTSIISMMSKFNVSELEERNVKVGTKEALELLKVSFHSNTVLSDVFLKTEKEEEQGSVQIRIQFIDKPSITVDVKLSDKIHKVKSKIEDKEGFLVCNQLRLIFNGKELDDSRTLADYNAKNESTLLLVAVFRSELDKEHIKDQA